METPLELLRDAAEELGEVARALGDKVCIEPACMESADLLICALALYFRTGGSDLAKDVSAKVSKWEQNVVGKQRSEPSVRAEPSSEGVSQSATFFRNIGCQCRFCRQMTDEDS